LVLFVALVILFFILADEDRMVSYFVFNFFFIRINSKTFFAAALEETVMVEICQEVTTAHAIKVEISVEDLLCSQKTTLIWINHLDKFTLLNNMVVDQLSHQELRKVLTEVFIEELLLIKIHLFYIELIFT